jgi:cytochrome P450
MRENAEKRGQNEEKPSLIELLIQFGDISKEEIVGEIATIKGAGTDTTSYACGYVLALLGENQHIQERVMQKQQDIFGDDILSEACEKRRSAKDGVPRTGRQLLASLFPIEKNSSNISAIHKMK